MKWEGGASFEVSSIEVVACVALGLVYLLVSWQHQRLSEWQLGYNCGRDLNRAFREN